METIFLEIHVLAINIFDQNGIGKFDSSLGTLISTK